MKFRITMKDPDGVYESIRDAAKQSVRAIEGLDEHEQDGLVDDRQSQLGDKVERWIKYGEYLTVEIDTDAGTCVVVEKGA